MKRHGKIARLSRERQHELNLRLQNGEPGVKVLDWLNGLPEMAAILQAAFGGLPVSKQNLSEWANGGFKEWQARQDNLAGILGLAGDAEELEAATQGRLADRLATVLAGRYATLLKDWDGQVTEEFSKQQKLLRAMIQDLAHLRRWDHSAARVRMEQAVHAANQELTNEAFFEQFEQWAKRPQVRDYLLMQQQTHREREERENERWELLKTPVKPPAEPPPISPLSDPAYNPHRHPASPAAPAPASNPVQASPGQSNLSAGVVTACRHNTPTPDLPSDHQPSSARPVADSINGEAGHGAEALIKNIPPPSCAPSQCALRDGSPAQSPEPCQRAVETGQQRAEWTGHTNMRKSTFTFQLQPRKCL